MLVQADALIETAERIHRPGHLRCNPRVLEVGSSLQPLPGEEVLSLPGLTLAPGFINLHAHLELAGLHGRLQAGKGFADWLRQIVSHLPELTPEKRRQSVSSSSRTALRTGTTSVLSILSDPSTLAGLASTATRTWWALEFMDLEGLPPVPEILDRTKAWVLRHPSAFWSLALSPHSPYTARPELYRTLAEWAAKQRIPFTTHLAESPEESWYLQDQPSPLRTLLPAHYSRRDLQKSTTSAVSWCIHNQTLPPFPILAHGNEVQEADMPFLLEKNASIVHCPLAHRWFGRQSFSLRLFQKHGIPVTLGTDSPASSSNISLDLRDEVAELRRSHPHVTVRDAWSMVTTQPALALQLKSEIGCLSPGAWADWIAWRIPSHGDPLEAILTSREAAEWSSVGGQITYHETV